MQCFELRSLVKLEHAAGLAVIQNTGAKRAALQRGELDRLPELEQQVSLAESWLAAASDAVNTHEQTHRCRVSVFCSLVPE